MYKLNKTDTFDKQFDLGRFIPFVDGAGYDFMNSDFKRELPLLPVFGKIVVSNLYIQRLDLLAYSLYKDTSYWWILLEYNYLDSADELKIGMTLQYPSPGDLNNLVTRMSSTYVENSKTIPVQEVSATPPPVAIELELIRPISGTLSFEALGGIPQSVVIGPNRIISSVQFLQSESWIKVQRIIDNTMELGGYFSVSCDDNEQRYRGASIGSGGITRTASINFYIPGGDSITINVSQEGTQVTTTDVFGFNGQGLGNFNATTFFK